MLSVEKNKKKNQKKKKHKLESTVEPLLSGGLVS